MAYSYNFTPRGRDKGDSQEILFKSLEFKGSRQRSLWMSIAVHGVLLTVLLVVPLLFTEAIKMRFDTVLLAPPPPQKQILEVTHYKLPKPQPKPIVKPEKPIAPPPVKPVLVEPPPPEKKPEPPKIAEVKIPEVVVREKPAPDIPKTPRLKEDDPSLAAPKIEIKTGVFSTGSSAKPTTTLSAAQVQTGGFGDPNGIKGEGKPNQKGAQIASLGSFDLPVGPGAGNGTGGARGQKGVVASSGFGNNVATVGNGGTGGGGGGGSRSVQQVGGFDTTAAKPEAPKKRVETGPPQTPVEILFKPKPDYTAEARNLKLEGEVTVRVLFAASGEVRVLDVVQGLGHGLDENAIRAAQQIKFKPALRDGQPVDSTATVRIVFQLAY